MENSGSINKLLSSFFIAIMILSFVMLLPGCNSENQISLFLSISSTSTRRPISTHTPISTWPPRPTTTPIPNYGWPVLNQEDFTKSKPDCFDHFVRFGYTPLLLDADTTILVDYSEIGISKPIDLYLARLYPTYTFKISPDGDLNIDCHGQCIDFIFGEVGEYEFQRSTSSELCLFFEAATLEGYGWAKFYGQSTFEGLNILISEFGNKNNIDDPNKFYCSNFDVASENFLVIAKSQGESELVNSLIAIKVQTKTTIPYSEIAQLEGETGEMLSREAFPYVGISALDSLFLYEETAILIPYSECYAITVSCDDPDWPDLMCAMLRDSPENILTGPIRFYLDAVLLDPSTGYPGILFIRQGRPDGIRSILPFIDTGELMSDEYIYTLSTRSQICGVIELSNADGYGDAKELGAANALRSYASSLGNPANLNDPTKLYCSNLDPNSSDYLINLRANNYDRLLEEIKN